ncbi:MAG TPA: hypothetical protein PKA27_13800 [Fimbriimonadaceae bacterium]|nr:hypothetical protein [Fimbriimonadaceae bacterium]
MKHVLITKDVMMAEEAKSPLAFPPGDEVIVESDWRVALDMAEGADMMFLDLLAALREDHKIQGYEEFAEAKREHPLAAEVPLVLIAPPEDYILDFMAGWPNFVFAHLRRPVTAKIFRRASTWV